MRPYLCKNNKAVWTPCLGVVELRRNKIKSLNNDAMRYFEIEQAILGTVMD
jgi:hypothetical protein